MRVTRPESDQENYSLVYAFATAGTTLPEQSITGAFAAVWN